MAELTNSGNFADVYFVPMRGLIEWMRNPVPLEQMHKFPWVQCQPEKEGTTSHMMMECEQPNKCIFPTPGLASHEHQMLTCSQCPFVFPWLGNPLGLF
jgi:hypothetical protein